MVGNAYICMLCIMIAVFWSVQRRMFSEQERNTPDGCNSYQAEYNSAYNGTLSSKQEANNIKLEDANGTPVNSANN